MLSKNPIIGDGGKALEDMAVAIREAESKEKLLSTLTRHGWVIISKAPHIKIHYRGNPRYFATLAASLSDKREKNNFISDIMKKINPYKGK